MDMLAHDRQEELLEEVVANYERAALGKDVVIVEGLASTAKVPYAEQLNHRLATSLDAKVILITAPGSKNKNEVLESLEVAARDFGGLKNERILGCILNQVGAPAEDAGFMRLGIAADNHSALEFWNTLEVKRLGVIPWQREMLSPRVKDIQDFIQAEVLHEGDMQRRVTDIALGSSTLNNASKRMIPGTFFITSGDRDDLFLAATTAALSGQKLAALLLTNHHRPSDWMWRFCKPGLDTGLPVLLVKQDSFQSALRVREMNLELPLDDKERLEQVMATVAAHVSLEWVSELKTRERRLSPAAFRHLLVERAREVNKRIILPEGAEPRTIKAASICIERGIARCALLGKPEEIKRVALQQGVTIPQGLELLDPDSIRHQYIMPMVELRKHKGLIPAAAEEQLQDNVVLGTMMLYLGDVDGLVSGAIHTTANTIRPALQLIKTPPGVKVVSSIFFMCLPEQVLVYGDCAVNPDPNPEELADIAIQSAESAKAFGIEPRVAMLSYSTGTSGSGSDVDKVRKATELARALRPDLLIDGPLQYDAAAIEDVAKSKAPDSKVAGRATVYIFPDLNTGNTTYKAVQRSADVISIGPMLQGLRKPVNDLSRGALVEDIIYTIALTAIQAKQAEG
jgi:phosphate acetyltransferase